MQEDLARPAPELVTIVTASVYDFSGLLQANSSCIVVNLGNSRANLTCVDLEYFRQSVDGATATFYYHLWTIATPVLFALIILSGTFGNLLVIYVICSRPAMQTPTNYLLINLAISDMAFLLICVPITAYKYVHFSYPFGDTMCRMISYIMYGTAYATVYTLVAISFLRYATVVHDVATSRIRSKRNAKVCNVIIWTVVLIVNSPCIFTHELKVFDVDFTYCGMSKTSIRPFFLTFFTFGYVIPLVVISALYIVTIKHLHNLTVASSHPTRMRKVLAVRASTIVIIVIGTFALLWLPLHVNLLLSAFQKAPSGKLYEVFRVVSNCLAYGNSCVNPIIYHFISRDFRRGFAEVILCSKKAAGANRHNAGQDDANRQN